MTDPSLLPDDGERAGRGRPTAAPRPRCPRCGASLGSLDASPSADAPTTARGASPASWYCGCCGLVLETPAA